MTAQVLFFNVFFEKDPHLNAVEAPAPEVSSAKYNQFSLTFMA